MSTMTESTIRLSLRELFEIPYRAFRVAGASHGEAQDSAEATQFAQVHYGTGLKSLIDICHEKWTKTPTALTRDQHPEHLRFVVTSESALKTLHFGPALVDLATSADQPVVVDVRLAELDACIDNPLRLGARRADRTLFAAQRHDDALRIRWATPTGDLGRAEVDIASAEARADLTVDNCRTHIGSRQESFLPFTTSAVITSAADLESRRAETALAGSEVDRELWAEINHLAQGFKQIDKEGKR